ncbi:MAG: hypothetical protein QF415_01555 [Candidatus Undinarchaeales archaeon]|nr:hypothetical protein [Candidatus Undinarchaeales archaeon]MDP7493392.1 hypothetical protein [Candidatus Undinarchaeales archaeon]
MIVADVDKTLTVESMEGPILNDFGVPSSEYWTKVKKNDKESPDTFTQNYVNPLLEDERIELDRGYLAELGGRLDLYDGVESFFSRMREWGAEHDIEFSFYLVSTGLKDVADNLSFADEMDGIYGTRLNYSTNDTPTGIAYALEPTLKPEFLDRIADEEHVDMKDVIYLGDGVTDRYAFDRVSEGDGLGICVISDKERDLGDVQVKADYSTDVPEYIQGYLLG